MVDAAGPEDDFRFDFNAPSYYDLNDGEFEKSYINNADGYFNQLDEEYELYLDSLQMKQNHLPDNNWIDEDQRSNTDSAPDSLDEEIRSRDFSVRSFTSQTNTIRKALTQPVAPALHSSKRAQALKNSRKPIAASDPDTIELQKKFHAIPIPISLDVAPNIAPNSVKPLTQPIMPKLATLARLGEKKHSPPPSKETCTTPRAGTTPRSRNSPVLPHSPKLQSKARHAQYQREFEERLRKEEENEKQKREFKARGMPHYKKRSSHEESVVHRPLTEPAPFNLSRSNRKVDTQLEACTLSSRSLPDLANSSPAPRSTGTPRSSERSRSKKCQSKPDTLLESERRAKAREEFEARRVAILKERAERQVREAAAKAKAEEDLLHEIRRQQTYKAKPYNKPVTSGFTVRPSTKELTTPSSPKFRTAQKLGKKKPSLDS